MSDDEAAGYDVFGGGGVGDGDGDDGGAVIDVASSSSSSSSGESARSTTAAGSTMTIATSSSSAAATTTTTTTKTSTTNSQLIEIQTSLETLNRQSAAKVLEIERQFNTLRQPLYEKRAQAIEDAGDSHFWFKAFCGHHTLRALLDDSDRDAFQYLRALSVRDLPDGRSGFRVALRFDPNPHFANAELSKEFLFADDGQVLVSSTPVQSKSSGARVPHSAAHGKRKRDDSDSFFAWFSPEDQDVTLGELIKDELWPNPLKFVQLFERGIDDVGDDVKRARGSVHDDEDDDDQDDEDQDDDDQDDDDDDDADNGNKARRVGADDDDDDDDDDNAGEVDAFGAVGSVVPSIFDSQSIANESVNQLPKLASLGSSFGLSMDAPPMQLVASSADFENEFDDTSYLRSTRNEN
jgi:template-activating factor I